MKKSLLFILLASAIGAANAQVVTSTSSLTMKSVKSVNMYVKAGLDIGLSSENIDMKTGYSILCGATTNIGVNGLYYGSEFGIAKKRFTSDSRFDTRKYNETERVIIVDYSDYSTSEGNRDYTAYKEDINFNGVEIFIAPVKFGYKFPLSEQWVADTNIGLYTSVGLKGGFSDSYTTRKYVGDTLVGVYNSDVSEYLTNSFLDVGLSLGVGVWYNNKFNFSIEYQKGLTCNIDPDMGNINVIKAAVAFRINKPKSTTVKVKK